MEESEMANQELQQFFDLVRQDRSLQDQFNRVTDSDQFAQLAVQLGASRGLRFDAADVKSVIEEQLASRRAQLSDAELEAVAGGVDLIQRMSMDCLQPGIV